MQEEPDKQESYPLHEAVFDGNIKKLSQLIRKNDIAKKDKHGNNSFSYFFFQTTIFSVF